MGVKAAIGTDSVGGRPRPGNDMRSMLIIREDMMVPRFARKEYSDGVFDD